MLKTFSRSLYLLVFNLWLPCISIASEESPELWYQQGQDALKQALNTKANKRKAKNVILFIGDGMGISTITAARILAGQLAGKQGEEHSLSFERLPFAALSKTYNTNLQIPDSAGTMSAIMTGVKTEGGFISVNQYAKRKDCASSKGTNLKTLLEELEERNYATGIVSTARITHATPAATYAHVPEREWEGDVRMPEIALQQGCQDIAKQLVTFPHGNGIEVIMGGGRRYFLPKDVSDPEYPGKAGKRKDGIDLVNEWSKRYKDGTYVWNDKQFASVKPENISHLLALFEPSHMQFEVDRQKDGAGEPSLAQMTGLAIRVLQKNKKGYFLMVEGGRIDHAHHYGNAYRALHDAIAFADAVSAALQHVDLAETLVIVTADHSHVFTMGGYPTRGNPILGKVYSVDGGGEAKQTPELAKDNKPYTTLGYYNGDGFAVMDDIGKRDEDKNPGQPGRADISGIDTEKSNYYQESLVPMIDETHGGEDVAIFAGGPWAHLFQGVHEQNYIYHVMRHALQLDK
jgi:alkaline phosphatase